MIKKQLRIGELNAKVGEKVQGMVKVYDTDFSMPVTLINGEMPGKTVLITGGLHGGEYPGIQTVIELAQELTPQEIEGQLIMIHPINVEAFRKKSAKVVPTDNRNLNQIFPGDKKGTLSEKIAYFIFNECKIQADFHMDLHGGDLHEQATNFVFYPGVTTLEVMEESKRVASSMSGKYIVRSKATTGAYSFGATKGLPGILIERGGRASWSKEEVAAYKKDIKMALYTLEVLKNSYLQYIKEEPVIDITKTIYLEAGAEGCWYPEVEVGQEVVVGQPLGTIKDFFGNTLKTYYAEGNGVILYMLITLSVEKEEPLVAYGLLDEVSVS